MMQKIPTITLTTSLVRLLHNVSGTLTISMSFLQELGALSWKYADTYASSITDMKMFEVPWAYPGMGFHDERDALPPLWLRSVEASTSTFTVTFTLL